MIEEITLLLCLQLLQTIILMKIFFEVAVSDDETQFPVQHFTPN